MRKSSLAIAVALTAVVAISVSSYTSAATDRDASRSTPKNGWAPFASGGLSEVDPIQSLSEARARSTHTIVGQITGVSEGRSYTDLAGYVTRTANIVVTASAPASDSFTIEMILGPESPLPRVSDLPAGKYLFFIFPGYSRDGTTVYGCLNQGWCGIRAVSGSWKSSTSGEVTMELQDEPVVPLETLAK